MTSNDLLIAFIPIAVCVLGILILLEVRERLQNTTEDTTTAIASLQSLNDSDAEQLETYEQQIEEDNDPGEGSSTAIHVKKIGKKKGEKLKKKEQMRQYREYMNHQRDIRRAQDDVLEEEFRRRKAEESIRREQESEQRRKAQQKKAKQEEKERVKREKSEEKEAQRRRSRFDKYSGRVGDAAKRLKVCTMETLARTSGFSQEEARDMLKELCATSPEFRLSLWSGSTFMFVTEKDYDTLAKYVTKNGRTAIGGADIVSILQHS